jgi:hypothetical protein
MTLIDRFRTQGRHKHPDPAVRLAYVEEIPLEEREVIASIAREDEDVRVRRAAIAKLMDPAALGAIAGNDRDETLRAQATAMLRDIAVEAFEGVAEADSLEAVDALTDGRALAQIAKTAGREIVALRALSRIADTRMLGSIARHATSEATRRGAFERLGGDTAEILAVAMNSEHKDTALAAVDLIADRSDLEQLVLRAKSKSAVKRARGMLREAEEREAREAALHAAEQPPSVDSGTPATAADAPPAAAPGPALEDLETEQDDRRAAAEEASRRSAEDEAARNRAAEQAAETARVRAEEHARRQAERARLRLMELADTAVAAAADPDLVAARKRFGLTRREWVDLAAGVAVEEELAARFAGAESQIVTRETEARAADAKARREALARMQHLLGRLESLAASPDLSLKAADRALREVRTTLAAVPLLPGKQDFDDVTRRLKALLATLTPKVLELREADEWQRWANVAVQERLCAQMEALRALDDPEAIAREVRELQQQWRQAADVPRAQTDQLWRRFKTAHDEAWGRAEAHFAAEAESRAQNLAQKTALCDRAEALAGSTSWIQTAEEIKRMQAEWKTIGPVSRGREKAVWDRFRAACDRFFTRRQEDLVARKGMWAENLAKKEALSVRAEALVESTDWEQTSAELRRLQAEWKTIGPVKKSRSEAIWRRFREACDRFFTRYAHRHDIARAERVAAREAICAELEALGSPERQEPPADLLEQVRALRARMQQEIAARGVDPEQARAIEARWTAAFDAVLARWPAAFSDTDLDPEANRKRMESLVRRVEDLATSVAGPVAAAASDAALSPTVRLAAMLKEALAANTIGGKVDDDSRWRAAMEEVRHAQESWSRIGLVPNDLRRPLTDRFQRAIRRISEGAAAKAAAAGTAGRAGGPTGRAGGAGTGGWTGKPGGAGKAGGGGRPGR